MRGHSPLLVEEEEHQTYNIPRGQNHARAFFISIVKSFIVGSVLLSFLFAPLEFSFWIMPPPAILLCSSVASLFIFFHSLLKLTQHFWTRKTLILLLDLVSCLPYGLIADKTKVTILMGGIWLRMVYFRKIFRWQRKLEVYLRRLEYSHRLLMLRMLSIVALDVFWIHTSACVLYYIASSQRHSQNSWLGSMNLGDTDFKNFKRLSFLTRYSVSLYFSYITISTVGYGDIHPQTLEEMLVIQMIILITAVLGIFSSYIGGKVIADFVEERKKKKQQRFLEEAERVIEMENTLIEEGRRREAVRHQRHVDELSRLMD